MDFFQVTKQHQAEFAEQGFVLARELLKADEVRLLSEYARADYGVNSKATSRSDAQGGTTTLALDNCLQDDLYSAVVRLPRVALNMGILLEDEVYHYHHKMMLKEAKTGGAWEWHQDYGYWYDFGCLYPTMASCFIAVDRATRENGCLQIIPGSHHLGRLNHVKIGGQTGADPERIEALLNRESVQHIEMAPGDGLFFHGNLLHRSDQNTSPNPRWSLICCYNTKSNNPYKDSRHPAYSPLGLIKDAEFESTARRLTKELAET